MFYFKLALPFKERLIPNSQILITTSQTITPEAASLCPKFAPYIGTKQLIAAIAIKGNESTDISAIESFFPDFFSPAPLRSQIVTSKADAIEIHPLIALKNGTPTTYSNADAFEPCDHSEATCYGIFLHTPNGGLEWQADYSSIHHANRAITKTNLPLHYA